MRDKKGRAGPVPCCLVREVPFETPTLLRKAGNGLGFGVVNIEDGHQLGDLQNFLELAAEMAEAQPRALGFSAGLRLCHLGSKFQEVLQITKLMTVFDVYNTEAEAVASFSK